MNAVDLAAELARRFEGVRLAPYLDPGGVPTIGYGTTIYPDGRRVSMDDPPITMQAAEGLLLARLAKLRVGVMSLFPALADSAPRMAAVMDFAYNVGIGALARSTLGARLREGRWDDAAAEFARWVYAGGKPQPGLIERRAAERAMFEAPP